MTDFEQFWKAYPRKIGKGAARNAFARAIKLTNLSVMLKAIADYIEHKPPRQDYCHPSTWLNQERWEDEWDTEPARNDHGLQAAAQRYMNGNFNDNSTSRQRDYGSHGDVQRLPAIAGNEF